MIQHPSYAFSIIELSILSFERERGEKLDKYLRRSYQRMNQMSFGGQALAWFISIKLSDFVLKKFENIGAPFFNLILGFILSVLFLTVGMLLLDSIEKNK